MSAAGKRYARAAVEAALERAGVAAVEELSKESCSFPAGLQRKCRASRDSRKPIH